MASNPAQIMGAAQSLVADPVTQDLQRQMAHLQIAGATLQNQAAAQQLRAQQVAMQRQQGFGQAVQDHLTNPSVQSLARVFSYPEFAAQAKEVSGAMDDRRKQSDLTQISAATGLAAKGDYAGAADIIDKRIAADKAAGVDSSADEHFSTALRSGDPQQQKNAFGAMTLALGAAVGPEKAGPYLEAMGLSKKPVVMKGGEYLQDPQGGPPIASAPLPHTFGVVRMPDGTEHPVAEDPNSGLMGPGTGGGAAPAAYTGGGGPASGAAAGAVPANGSRADRNNNPGNLRAINPGTGKPVSWVTSLPGYQGADAQGYAIFAPGTAAGTAGQQALLGRYFKAGRNTVSSIVERWAPRESAGGDNTDAQVNNYTAYVARQLGVDPKQPLPPSAIPQLAAAMHQFESGATGHAGAVRVPAASAAAPQAQAAPGAAPAGTAGIDPNTGLPVGGSTAAPANTNGAPKGFAWNADHTGVVPLKGGPEDAASYSPQEIHDAAVELLTTGEMPKGMGMGGAALKKTVLAKRSQIMKQLGITADQLPQFRARYAADKGTYQNIVGMESGLAASEHALLANFQQVRQTQQKLVDLGILGNSPDLNGAKIRWVEHFGSPEQKAALQQYRLAINGSQGEYAKFMSTNTGMGNAPSTDSARAKAGEMIEEGGAVSATNGGIDQLMKEAANKRAGVTAQRVYLEHKLSSYLGGAGAPAAPATAAPPANHAAAPAHAGGLPPGAHQVGTYQGKPVYQLPNGKKVMAR